MNNDEQDKEIFISFVEEVIQKLRKYGRYGINKILKDIDGAEDISEIDIAEPKTRPFVFHMSQFEVGYVYILNSNVEWINILMPLNITENHSICSYLNHTIFKMPHPQEKIRYWTAERISNYQNTRITRDSYWDNLSLCLKIPIPISVFHNFINWINENPLEVKG